MFGFEGHRIRTTGNLQRQLGDAAGRRGVSGRNLRAQFDPVGAHDPEQRRAFFVRRAKRRHHLDDAAGNRRAQRERVAGSGAAAAAQRLVALRRRACAACSRASAVANARRASSTRRAGTARSASSRSARVNSARAASTATWACATSPASVARSSLADRRGSSRPSTWPARTVVPIVGSDGAAKPTSGRRGNHGFPASERFDRGRNLDRASQLDFAHRRRGELVGPLLLLQVGDCRRVARRLLFRLREGGLLVGEDGHHAEVVAVGEAGCVDRQRPPVAASGRRHALDPKRPRTERRCAREHCGSTAGFRRERHRGLARRSGP